MAESADRVLIATDPDREGEAIAWHLAELLKIDAASSCRISFNEITEPAVQNAVSQPRPIDMNLVNAQQARRILDRLVGYELSPLLWKKVKKGLSAGRVQSVATRLVVEREREIEAFKPDEYWLLTAWLRQTASDPLFRARYHGEIRDGSLKKEKLTSQGETEAVIKDLDGRDFSVWNLKKSTRQRQPAAPFTTSTLQQEAARYLGFTARRTMSVAQQLYEGVELPQTGAVALVTYIRTDSVRVSDEAGQEARKHILNKFGDEYLPRTTRRFKNKNSAQDAHEAIRPAHFDLEPDSLKDQLSYDQFRLYRLIWDKFIASQMAAAVVDTVTADIAAGSHVFRAQGETVRFRVTWPSTASSWSTRKLKRQLTRTPAARKSCPNCGKGRRCWRTGGSGTEIHPAAAPLHRSDPDQGFGRKGDRPPIHLRTDGFDHPGPVLRRKRRQAPAADRAGQNCDRFA
jgi:DNA topoisomerase-1